MSAKYSGLSYPFMFKGMSSNVVTDIDKMRANILLLLNLQVRSLLMRPEVGIDTESLLFTDDILITRDFVYTFVKTSVLRDMPDVDIRDVTVKTEKDKLFIHIDFIYKVGNVEFNVDYLAGGVD